MSAVVTLRLHPEAGSADFVRSKLCGCWYGNRRKAAQFPGCEALRLPSAGSD
jgi:hypothetical protein